MSCGTLALMSEARGSIFEPEIFSSEPLVPEDILSAKGFVALVQAASGRN